MARYRVLVADDHHDHVEMIARAVRSSRPGAQIDLVTVHDGEMARAMILDGVDLAFLDIKMPGMTGIQVLRSIRTGEDVPASVRQVPIVIVSSSSDPWDTQISRDSGAMDYVEKGRYGEFRSRIVDIVDRVLGGSNGTDGQDAPSA